MEHFKRRVFFGLILTTYTLSLLLSGCGTTSYNVATQRQETLMIGTEREVAIGEAVAKRVEKEFSIVRDPEMLRRLDRVGELLAAASDRKDLIYHFAIVEEKEPNAFTLPGGFIYTTTGLMELAQSDDELAAVLGHEMGHVVAKHTVKRMQGAIGLQLLQVIALSAGARDAQTRQGIDLAFASLMMSYSQQDELEADRLSVKYLKHTGYRPDAAIDFLERLRDYTQKQPLRRFSYFRSHPFFADRIRIVRQEAQGQITFDDYINVQNSH